MEQRAFPNDRAPAGKAVTSELISSLHREARTSVCPFRRFRPFQFSRAHLCSGVNSCKRPRRIGNVVHRSSVALRSGGQEKSAGRKTTEEKTKRRYDLFVLIIIALIIARGVRALSSTLFTHTRVHGRWKERPRLGISKGTWVRLIREADLTARTRVRRITSPRECPRQALRRTRSFVAANCNGV